MRTTSSVTFYVRESKVSKKTGLAPIEASITLNGQRTFLALPVKVKPSEFNCKKQPRHIVRCVDEWRVKFIEMQNELLSAGIPLTADNLKRMVQTGGIVSYTLSIAINDYLKILKHRCDCPVYRKYEMVYERLLACTGDKETTQITNGEITRFYSDLCEKYKPQTSSGMFQKVRSLFKYMLSEGKIKTNPCEGIRVSRGKMNIDFLTEEEISILENANIDNDALKRTLDVFLFQCCSGLAYCDVATLEAGDIKELNGTYFIQKQRRKTGTSFTAVIIGNGMDIWNRYHGKLPVLTNQKMNLNLKMIGDILQFPKHLHCHLSRHTYCTRLLNSGVRLEIVAECAGHKNTLVTKQYYAVLHKETVLSEVSSAFKK